MSNIVKLADRIKELSYTVGTGNMTLEGAAVGFNSFGSYYNYNDYLFYAITDGSSYEIGSGQYILSGSDNKLKRFPFKSSNNNQIVNFSAGLKEVYVTYPATHSVYIGSGISNLNIPEKSGVSFWDGSNTLNYDSNFIWDNTNKRLGIRKASPQYAIDIGGAIGQSSIQASGYHVGKSGIYFPAQNNEDINYTGGRQLVHFDPNQLGDNNLNAIMELSGVVDNIFLLKKQNAGLVFAGPPSGCVSPCSPALPSFRPLILKDIEEMVVLSGDIYNKFSQVIYKTEAVYNTGVGSSGYLAKWTGSNSIGSGILYESGNKIGIGTLLPTGALHIVNNDIALYVGDYSIWTGGGKLRIFVDDDDSQSQAIKSFVSRSGVGTHIGVNGTSYTIGGGGSGTNIGLYGYADNGSTNWGLYIDAGKSFFQNNVGIKTLNPQYSLDVVGTGNFSQNLLVNGSGVSLSGHKHVSNDITNLYDTDIYDLGNIQGTVSLDWATNKTIQTASLSGLATTFNKGTGWPTTNISRDLLLKLNVTSGTDITWNIVGSNWYKQPSGTTLSSGEYMFVLRAFGPTIINGFYIGQKTGSL